MQRSGFSKDIANHPNLVNISLRYMNSIYEVPKFKNPGKIKSITFRFKESESLR